MSLNTGYRYLRIVVFPGGPALLFCLKMGLCLFCPLFLSLVSPFSEGERDLSTVCHGSGFLGAATEKSDLRIRLNNSDPSLRFCRKYRSHQNSEVKEIVLNIDAGLVHFFNC